jgi:hypothetical protein
MSSTDPTGAEDAPVIDLFSRLANRPQCEHGLNGPCNVCGEPPHRHRFFIGDDVTVPPTDDDQCTYGTVLELLDRNQYLVNVGNVFGCGGIYERVYDQRQLSPLTFDDAASEPY